MQIPKFKKHVIQCFIILIYILLVTLTHTIDASAQEASNRQDVPKQASCLFYHQLGLENEKLTNSYERYGQGMSMAMGDYLAYRTNAEDETNGIKYEITDEITRGESGEVFGASLHMYVENWSAKATLFFEIISEDRLTIKRVVLGEFGPNSDKSNLTTNEDVHGEGWLATALKGEARLEFSKTDRIYLCCTQKDKVHRYDEVSLWHYTNEYEPVTDIYVSTPKQDASGTFMEFNVENLTDETEELIVTIQSEDEEKCIVHIEEYRIELISGLEREIIRIPAVTGNVVSITDSKGNVYVRPFDLGSMKWVGTWASSQLTAGADTYPPQPGLSENTYRQAIRVSNGGEKLRITFTNEYGEVPLELISVHISRQLQVGSATIDPLKDTVVTFEGGKESIIIPAGETITSDVIDYPVNDLELVMISMYFGKVPDKVTSHTASRSTNWLGVGNQISDENFVAAATATSWYFLSAVDTYSTADSKAVVCFGDSITDGYGVKTDSYGRWSDILAQRLQENEATTNVSVLNEGIGGNAIFGGNGPAARIRFERDVLELQGVEYVIILIGINDIGYATVDISDNMIKQYTLMIERAHEQGIKVYGGTILPFRGSSYFSADYGNLREQIRNTINDWMLSTESGLDGVIDFNKEFTDAQDKEKMLSVYVNDFLHPNTDGYRHMGEIIDLSLFE